MSRRSGILLFNSRGTCARCLGSRGRFDVNLGFTDGDRILIENLYIFKGYGANKLIKEFRLGFKLTEQITLNYLIILPVCFASFFLASCDVIT